jgi:hypothetical protein
VPCSYPKGKSKTDKLNYRERDDMKKTHYTYIALIEFAIYEGGYHKGPEDPNRDPITWNATQLLEELKTNTEVELLTPIIRKKFRR